MTPPGAIGRLARVDHEAECVIADAEFLCGLFPRRFDEPADRILVIPALGLMLRVGDVVHVVLDLGAQVEILFIPSRVVARLQVLLGWRFLKPLPRAYAWGYAVIGEPVDRRIVPWRLAQPEDIPQSVRERDVLPFGQIAINDRRAF